MTKICLDAAHGGRDSGAVGPTGVKESVIALAITQHLAKELTSLNGVTSILTRSSDVFIELAQRCKIANDWRADLFVSVHLNSDGPTANGIETLFASDRGRALSAPIQKALLVATGERDRGLKERKDLRVLNGTNMPASLLEVGFVSHPGTEEKFKRDDYRRLLARAICAGLADYLKLTMPPITPPTQPTLPAPTAIVVEVRAPKGVEIKVLEL